MQPKSLILLVLALGCGMVAAIGVTQMMADSGNEGGFVTTEVEPIYVALEDVEMGRPISVEVIKLEDWPKGKAPVGALSQLEDVEGRAPRTKLFAGEPILDFKLLTKGEMTDGADIMIPKDYRVVPVKVDDVSGGSGMILPGNRVDVYLHVKRSSEFQESMVKQILQNVKVFAVGDTWSRTVDDEKTMRAKTVSLLLEPSQAMKVTLAAKTGDISLVLRSPEDEQAATVEQVGVGDLFTESELADTRKDSDIMYEKQKTDANKQNLLNLLGGDAVEEPVISERWGMRIITGERLTDVSMELDDAMPTRPAPDGKARSGFWKMTTPWIFPTRESEDSGEKSEETTSEEAQDGEDSEQTPEENT